MGCGAPKRNHTTLWPKREKTVHSDRLLGLSLARQGNSKAHAGDDAAEGRVAVAQIAIHRVRRDCLVVIAGAASGSMLLGVEHDQALRIVHGESDRGVTWWSREKMAVLAPIPRATETAPRWS